MLDGADMVGNGSFGILAQVTCSSSSIQPLAQLTWSKIKAHRAQPVHGSEWAMEIPLEFQWGICKKWQIAEGTCRMHSGIIINNLQRRRISPYKSKGKYYFRKEGHSRPQKSAVSHSIGISMVFQGRWEKKELWNAINQRVTFGIWTHIRCTPDATPHVLSFRC